MIQQALVISFASLYESYQLTQQTQLVSPLSLSLIDHSHRPHVVSYTLASFCLPCPFLH